VESERDGGLAAVDPFGQLAKAPDTAYEVDPFVGSEIFDAEQFVEHET
jgi:hypothetical protein